MITVAVTAILSVAAGILLERRDSDVAAVAARWAVILLLYVLTPFVIMVNIGLADLTHVAFGALLMCWLVVAGAGLLTWRLAVAQKLPRPQVGAMVCLVVVANTGFVGFPLTTALLGRDALPQAVLYDLVVNAPMFFFVAHAVAAATGTKAEHQSFMRAFAGRNAVFPAAIIGLLVPAGTFDATWVDVAHVVTFALAPLGFFNLGIALTAEAQDRRSPLLPALTRPVATVLTMRNLLAPLALIALSALVLHVPAAYRLEAAMGCGLSILGLTHLYGMHRGTTASAVAWSNAAVIAVAVTASLLAG